MRTEILLSFVLMLGAAYARAQNLVRNPSFEDGARCDGQSENIERVEHWTRIAGEPRFINVNCPLSRDNKSYIQGMQLPQAFAGGVYAGMGAEREGEYLQGELQQPLQAGERYWVRLRLRLPNRFCNAPLDEFGVHFSSIELASKSDMQHLYLPALSLVRGGGKVIETGETWLEIGGLYTATGGERYLTLGVFGEQNAARFARRKKGECSYVFIDAVSVARYEDAASLPIFKPELETLPKNERFLLEGIAFENEQLRPESLETLDALAAFLRKNGDCRIEISAHCDGSRTEAEAQNLTAHRAKLVADYIVKKGIAADRVFPSGKGYNQLLVPNGHAEQAQKNNRIELRGL